MYRTLTLATGVLILVGCSDQGLHEIGDANGANGPRIQVDPEVIDFGSFAEAEVGYEFFTITNIGEGDLHIQDIELGAYSDGFNVVTPPEELEFFLPAGASQDIEVSFTPYGVEMATKALITSDDSEVEVATVDLLGQGQVPELKIDPDPYDFGKTYVGCPREGVVTMSNIGTGPLTVNYIDAYNDGEFVLDTSHLSLPYELQPEESFEVYLDFDPDADLEYNGELSVTSTEPMGTRIATQTGEGKYTAVYKDDFVVPTNPPADIMFLVDQSCSMDDDQQRLQQNFSYFISNLNSYTNNWQVMVVNDDNGCTNSGILTKNTPNYQQKFNQAVTSGGGSHTESLLTPAAEAAHKAGNSGCNAGFMRQGALLHIIPVSDEPEQSNWTSGKNWSDLVTDLQNTKGSPSLVKISAIVGDYPNGCGTADPGTGYYEAVNYTGGEFLSICASNWSSYMPLLAEASISMDTFELTATPVESTIEVRVNGNTVDASAWEYDATGNTVRIIDNPPGEGDAIKIIYAGLANCD